MQLPPGELVALRAAWFKKWVGRIEELETEEIALKESMPDHLKRILQPKRLLVFREMLSDMSYPDLGVFDEIVDGTVKSIYYSSRSSGDREVDDIVYAKTLGGSGIRLAERTH